MSEHSTTKALDDPAPPNYNPSMSTGSKARKMDTAQTKRLLQGVVDELVDEIPALSAVVLFGSWAKGTAGPDSDIDLLVVGDFTQTDACEVCHRPLDGTTVEMTMMGIRTLLDDLRRGHPFALAIVRDGVALHDAGVMARLRRAAADRPGRSYIGSYLRLARERLGQGDLRAAATSIINARRLLQNNVSISCHLEALLGGEPAPGLETVSRWLQETEEAVGSPSVT